MNHTTRFSAICPSDDISNLNAYIFGNGAIGSFTAEQLCRMGVVNFNLFDNDSVEIENVGVSGYYMQDIGRTKAHALALKLREINDAVDIKVYIDKITEDSAHRIQFDTKKSLVILAFDNMETRYYIAESACKSRVPYLLDARMGAETFQLYTYVKPRFSEYVASWYSDDDGDDEPCNAKATPYCASMAGAFIANSVRKLITQQPFKRKILFNFPAMLLVNTNHVISEHRSS
tara:strand:- start:107 stop:802 length:696 start_codon:yes stop_codon:yes gene_type:complete